MDVKCVCLILAFLCFLTLSTLKYMYNGQLLLYSKHFWAENNTSVRLTEMPHTKDKFHDMLQCQSIRKGRLKYECNTKYSHQNNKLLDLDTIYKKAGYNFIVDHHHKVMVKSLPKTGCTSWHLLMMMNSMQCNKSPILKPHNWSQIMFQCGLTPLLYFNKQEIDHMLDSYYSVLTVRHPLSRLESAFMDKFVYHGKYQHQREKDTTKFDQELIYGYFQDFLDMLLSTNWPDVQDGKEHWCPQVTYVYPCVIPYRHIAKTETASMELEYISQVKLSGVGGALHENKLGTKTFVRQRQDGGEILPLFSGLEDPAKTIQRLQTSYGQGMKLFGYSVKIENSQVIAVCDNFEEYGMCC